MNQGGRIRYATGKKVKTEKEKWKETLKFLKEMDILLDSPFTEDDTAIDVDVEDAKYKKHGGRINFNSGGAYKDRLKAALIEDLKTKVPGISLDQLQFIVKDITEDMSADEAQKSVLKNLSVFSMAEGGKVSSGLARILGV